jgi:drug/metabolite transporter (DMT)-like permease
MSNQSSMALLDYLFTATWCFSGGVSGLVLLAWASGHITMTPITWFLLAALLIIACMAMAGMHYASRLRFQIGYIAPPYKHSDGGR